jgi:hypothetical protein
MSDERTPAQCPFLGEMVVIYCQAYPVRKPIPKHPITANNPCMGGAFKACPFFKASTDAEEYESAAGYREAADH